MRKKCANATFFVGARIARPRYAANRRFLADGQWPPLRSSTYLGHSKKTPCISRPIAYNTYYIHTHRPRRGPASPPRAPESAPTGCKARARKDATEPHHAAALRTPPCARVMGSKRARLARCSIGAPSRVVPRRQSFVPATWDEGFFMPKGSVLCIR